MADEKAVTEPQDESTAAYKAVNPNHPRLAIKHDKLFLLMDTEGLLPGGDEQGFGLYADDTRWLKTWNILINGKPLFLLHIDVGQGFAARATYNNHGLDGIPDQSLLIERSIVLTDVLSERLTIANLNASDVTLDVVVEYAADFAHMFEVRGARREKRGASHLPVYDRRRGSVTLGYTGLDKVVRQTRINFRAAVPPVLEKGQARFRLAIPEKRSTELEFVVRIKGSDQPLTRLPRLRRYTEEEARVKRSYRLWRSRSAVISTENEEFNLVLERAYNDLYVLRQQSPRGYGIAAGVPWFAQLFGRDGAIAGLQTVAFMPDMSQEELLVLAAYQGVEHDPVTAQAPGKIMHELRVGEMANLKEIAFRPYYGTVDATQLWLMLLCEYAEWTGDLSLVERLWPNVLAALDFLDKSAGGGYITYGGTAGEALTNQGWKDSFNAIMYSDGKLAKAPIAVCEAQGYLYVAWAKIARLAALRGDDALAARLALQANRLRTAFQRDFWMPDRKFVAIALDADGRQCDVVSSNPGHLIGTGILTTEQERLVAARLMDADMFCGWGIRTLSSREVAFQPMDYQVGSVWPHDNGFAVEGMCRIGETASAHKVMRALFDVARNLDDHRLPELYCGFDRDGRAVPVRYPVACVPQAWAAGCIFHMLKACFNIVPDAFNNRLRIVNPSLPSWLGKVTVNGLRIGDARLDLEFAPSSSGTTTVKAVSRSGKLDMTVEYTSKSD